MLGLSAMAVALEEGGIFKGFFGLAETPIPEA
jgi:hypothetical protein